MADKQTLRIGEGKPGPGRTKGVPNKTTALLKEAVLAAAELAGGDDAEDRKGGLIGYLQTQAKDNPGPFMALLGKIIPLQVDADVGGKIIVQWAKDE